MIGELFMGLDNFWVRSVEVCLDKKYGLQESSCSGTGDGSFRGGCYHELIEALTGVSLYEDRICNEGVEEMAKALGAAQYDESWAKKYEVAEEEFKSLASMFHDYAEAGCDLVSWS
jgi:hypothetical protein